jgi:Family of unknown function (DUF5670)
MLWTVVAIVLVLWLIGLLVRIGPVVNLLLVVAAVLLVAQALNERQERP